MQMVVTEINFYFICHSIIKEVSPFPIRSKMPIYNADEKLVMQTVKSSNLENLNAVTIESFFTIHLCY